MSYGLTGILFCMDFSTVLFQGAAIQITSDLLSLFTCIVVYGCYIFVLSKVVWLSFISNPNDACFQTFYPFVFFYIKFLTWSDSILQTKGLHPQYIVYLPTFFISLSLSLSLSLYFSLSLSLYIYICVCVCMNICVHMFDLVLPHIDHWRLFNAKSIL